MPRVRGGMPAGCYSKAHGALSSAVCNVVLGREQRTCPLRGTNGCYLSMDLGQVEMVGRFRDVEDRCLGI